MAHRGAVFPLYPSPDPGAQPHCAPISNMVTFAPSLIMATDLDQAYRHCQRVAKEHASNFYYAFRTLPAQKRRAIYSAYAFCRLCDDIADGDLPIEAKREELARVRLDLSDALSPEPPLAPSPEFRALGDSASAFDIPINYFEEVIDGVESDLTKTRFSDFSELRTYCYKVASVVGLICIEIFGYRDPAAREYAVDMGIALQLTNIMRDVKEDAERDRIYIPQEDLARFGYSEDDLMRGVMDENFKSLMKFQADRARSYYENSRPLFDLIEPESRACIRLLHTAYAAILDRIEAREFDVFSQRVGLSVREKLTMTARLWIGSMAPRLWRP